MTNSKRKLVPFKEMDIKNKVLRLIIIILSLGMSITSLILLIKVLVTGNDPHNRLVSYISVTGISMIPILLEIFKVRFSFFLQLFYLSYVFFAAFLGNVFLFYINFSFYDKIMHALFGYVGSLIGLLLLCKIQDYKELKPAIIVILCFSVSMALAALWEVGEFIGDNFMGQTAQGIPIEGKNAPLVTDTMLDICCNLGGAFLFVIHYLFHIYTKKGLLLNYIKEDFSTKNFLTIINKKASDVDV